MPSVAICLSSAILAALGYIGMSRPLADKLGGIKARR